MNLVSFNFFFAGPHIHPCLDLLEEKESVERKPVKRVLRGRFEAMCDDLMTVLNKEHFPFTYTDEEFIEQIIKGLTE